MSLKGVISLKIWIFEFLRFFWIFPEFYLIFLSLFKNGKKGILFSTELVELTWRAELTWRTGPARIRHGTRGHVAEPRGPMWRPGGTTVAQTHGRATQVHAEARVAPHGERESD